VVKSYPLAGRLFVVLGLVFLQGCQGDPELHPVTGKVTLGGRSFNRLLVYMYPLEGQVTPFNLGVGETDVTGKLSLRSTAGMGLAPGKYRVSFSCIQPENAGGQEAVDPNEKPDDENRQLKLIDLVPDPYDNQANARTSPEIFEIKSGENVFEFDIPTK